MALTRGDFGAGLFDLLGLSASTTSPVFTDGGGRMDGVLNALYDAGITNGIGDNLFGTNRGITRGEAFTMLARAYGLADKTDDIETSSQKLVDAGIVKGYEDGTLGLGDALQDAHMQILFDRVSNQLTRPDSGFTPVTDDTVGSGEADRLDSVVMADPEFVATLRGLGLSEEQARATHDYQTTALQNRLAGLGDVYGDQRQQAQRNINTGAEQRGMFRSGHRLKNLAESDARITQNQTRAEDAIGHEIDALGLGLAQTLAGIERDRALAEADARGRLSQADYNRSITEYEASI